MFRIRIRFNADSDPAFYLNADPDPAFCLNEDSDLDPDPESQTNADLRGSGKILYLS